MRNANKDLAAILARIVLEDALKRLAQREGIDENQRASSVNDELKRQEVYPQTQWRLIQAWLDIGNAAAHGRFDEYRTEDVVSMTEGLERFLAIEFRG